jgi:hypothetical protein
MLTFAYRTSSYLSPTLSDLPDVSKASAANLVFCIALYRVADKHNYPELMDAVEYHFTERLHWWLRKR